MSDGLKVPFWELQDARTEIADLQASLAAANERVEEQEAVIGAMMEALTEAKKWVSSYTVQNQINEALANAPARASAMVEVVTEALAYRDRPDRGNKKLFEAASRYRALQSGGGMT